MPATADPIICDTRCCEARVPNPAALAQHDSLTIWASCEDVMALPPKARGEVAEVRTAAKLMELGVVVAKPFGDSAKWDLIVEAGMKISRLQVKSAWVKTRQGYAIQCGGRERQYGPENIDFLVGYVAPEETWYIFPARVIEDIAQLYIKTDPKWKLARYRERWDLLFARGDAARLKLRSVRTGEE